MAVLNSPIKVFVSESIFEDNVTVNFTTSGNSSSSVSGFLLQHRISADGLGFKAWTQIADIPAGYDEYTYQPNLSRGEYIQFRVKVKSIDGENYYSDWTESDLARKNSLPSAVQSLNIDKVSYQSGENIVLTWIGSQDIDNSVSYYEIQISKNNAFWETYKNNYTLSCTVDPSEFGNSSTMKFRVCAVDDLGVKSEYVETGLIYRNESAEIRVCKNNSYQDANVYYCKNGAFERVKIFVCNNKTYESLGV